MAERINRRNFLIGGAAGAAAFAAGRLLRAATQDRRRPNVVYIMADDLGYGDLGCYGCTDVRTRNIDGLARDGARLTNFYAAGPDCTPTRCAFVTGCYPARVGGGLEEALGSRDATTAGAEQGLPRTEMSIAKMLKESGYATGLMGKWHLGYTEESGPNAHGFDEFFGFRSGRIDPLTHKNLSGEPDLFENNKPVAVEGHLTDLITQRSVAFVDRHYDRPFFLAIMYQAPHWATHGPNHADKANPTGDSPGSNRAAYTRMIERMDESIGRILAALERRGLTRDTLVIFCSDNGGDGPARNAPLARGKNELWEGGVRVPAIIRWPDIVPPGKTISQQAITMDLTATFLAATETVLPRRRRIDGENLFPILLGKSAERDRTLFWRRSNQKAVLKGQWKYINHADEGEFLFDLAADAGETKNLAAQHPERTGEMRELLASWETEIQRSQRRRARRWEDTYG